MVKLRPRAATDALREGPMLLETLKQLLALPHRAIAAHWAAEQCRSGA